jgi:outer membrane protein
MNFLKTRKALSLLAVLMISISSFAQSIGHIDFQTLLATMPETAQIQSELNAMSVDLENRYNKYVGELTAKETEYANLAADASTAAREGLEMEIRNLYQVIQNFETNSREDVLNKQNELMSPLIEKAQNAVNSVAEEKGLSYVLDIGTLIYTGTGAVDITEDVKMKLNL